MKAVLVGAYLAAIVAANLILALAGPTGAAEWAVYNAFLFVGLDLTTRDALHDYWRGHLLRNMAALIAAGSAFSYIFGLWLGVGQDVGRIALASCIAFACAATTDALVYHHFREQAWLTRVSRSNLASAAVDSLVFIALWPFGFSFYVAFTLFAAKVAGGTAWAFIIEVTPGQEWTLRNRRLWSRA